MKKIRYKIVPQNGFTLLEVMVAMVIFAVGMLGLASIQALSLENSHSSYSRSQAILLAYDMVDRMKANPTAGNNYVITAAATVSKPDTLCDTVACNDTEMATYDHWQWKSVLPNLLVSGKGQVANTPVGSNNYTITVYWDEDRSGVTGTNCTNGTPDSSTDLRCFQLTTQL